MYDKRISIFAGLIAAIFMVCILRLVQLQLRPGSSIQDEIAKLKLQRGRYQQIRTLRGRILDRKGRLLATDEPQFQLHINYKLTSLLDQRVRKAALLKAATGKHDQQTAVTSAQKELDAGLEVLQQIIEKCTQFGVSRTDIEDRIKKINDDLWNLRTFIAWRRNCPDSEVLKKSPNINSISFSDAVADFQRQFPDENQQLLLVNGVEKIAEMEKSWPLLELETDSDVFTAQLEFMNVTGVEILPEGHRVYPYGSVAAQTIGWVGPPQKDDTELFAGDHLLSYVGGEVCGREDGVEYVCESLLRGRRGEVFYDIDREMINRTESRFGRDIHLTLDIELQKKIENYLADCTVNPNCKSPSAAVVIDVATGDILALVSTPSYDLNLVRRSYDSLAGDSKEPLRNRAINQVYPPGSVIKPLILIAGLACGKITPDEIISCPERPAPKGWPNCLQFKQFHSCHDWKWQDQGGNKARNALKGSCNIYFSRLADRIDSAALRKWLFDFGYGRKILFPPAVQIDGETSQTKTEQPRNLRQMPGTISSGSSTEVIADGEKRFFGIGQGNLRATPLQVANAVAAIARGGLYRQPQLFLNDPNDVNDIKDVNGAQPASIYLNIPPAILKVVRDGMYAVVNESGGTAYSEFVSAGFAERGVAVYGKTGSTEAPENAWFAGFAEDGKGKSIAVSVLVEGGKRGSSDAAPLARQIIQFCIDSGCLCSFSR